MDTPPSAVLDFVYAVTHGLDCILKGRVKATSDRKGKRLAREESDDHFWPMNPENDATSTARAHRERPFLADEASKHGGEVAQEDPVMERDWQGGLGESCDK